MATARPFAYNTGSIISGTDQIGDFSVGTPTTGFTNMPQYWNGPDEDLGYIIAQPVPAGNQPNPLSGSAYVGFFRTDGFSDSAFIELTSVIAGQTFTGTTDALIWLDDNGYYTSFSIYPSSLLVYLDSGNVDSYSGSGTTWYDLTMNNNDATLINTPTFSSSYNGILQFDDAALEYATIPNIGNLPNWTVEVWFRLTSSLSSKVTSLVSNQFNGSNLNFSIGTNNAPGNFNLTSGFYDGAWRNVTGIVPATNTWYQVVGTYDGTTIRQYVNGVASGGTSNYVGIAQSGGDIRLMRRWDSPLQSANLVDGDLAIVKIYNTALTSTEILQSYNDNSARFVEPTPTPTVTPTTTNTPTPTITQTSTNTPTPSITASQTVTPTVTTTPTQTSSPTPSVTASQTPTVTTTPTTTNTPTPSTALSPVTSGLEIYYDPSNSSSYPGSGTILYDLSPSGVNATLAGSPRDQGNWLSFSGSQSIVTGNLIGLFAGWQHTLEIWVRPTTFCSVFSDTGTGPTNTSYHTTGLEFYSTGPFTNSNMMLYNTSTAVTRIGGGVTPLNNWYQYVRVYNGSNTAYAYVNKVKSSDTTITWTTPTPGWYLNFGSSDSTFFATGSAFQGQIGVIRLYNRVLSQSEINQNYDADKSKYGL